MPERSELPEESPVEAEQSAARSGVGKLPARLKAALDPRRPLRARLINIGHMLSGNAVSLIFGLISLAMAMRSLGPAEYGVLALVVSYARLIDRIVRFESWQPLIKYAAGVTGADARRELRQLYAFGLRLDMAACTLAALITIAIAYAAQPIFGLGPDAFQLILIFSLSLFLNPIGMPTAVLRFAGKFKTIAYVQVLGNLLRIFLCLYGLWNDSSLVFFAWVWAGCQAFTTLVMLGLSWIELRRQGIGNPVTVSCKGVTERFPGIWGFAWSSNLSMTIRSSANDLDVLIVGWLADPASAGIYYFAKRFAKAVQQVNVQVQAVLYPDVARLWAQGAYRKFVQATRQIQIFLAGCFLVALAGIYLLGPLLIRLGPGNEYAAALPMLLVQIMAVGITTHAAPSRTALLAMGRQAGVLKVVLVGTLFFHATLFLLVPRIGAMGANFAHVLLAGICAVAFDLMVRSGVATARAEKRSPGGPDLGSELSHSS